MTLANSYIYTIYYKYIYMYNIYIVLYNGIYSDWSPGTYSMYKLCWFSHADCTCTSSDCDSQKQSDYGSLSNQQRLTCLLCINQLHNIYIINSYSICPTASPLCLHLEYGPNSVFDLVHILSVSPSLYIKYIFVISSYHKYYV